MNSVVSRTRLHCNNEPAQKVEQESKPKRRSKGFGKTKEAVINLRLWKLRQHWDTLKQDFTLKSRSVDIVYDGYAPTLDLDTSTILLQGWLGAGKTEALVRTLAVTARHTQIVWIAPRNGLLRQSAERLKALGVNTYHYQDDPTLHQNMLRTGQPGVFMMAPDSLKPYMIEHTKPENLILVIDEFSGIRSEVTAKRTEFPGFEKLLAESKQVIAVDAFLSDIDYAVLSQYRNMRNAKIYRQRFQKSQKLITWLEVLTKADSNGQQAISFSHEGLYLPVVDEWIESGVGDICIAIDNKMQGKALMLHLESRGRKVLLVCADTPDQSQPFMQSPDQVWAQGGYDTLIYTPTAQSGLDVQSYFERGLLISNGIISPSQMVQMMGRCRQCQHWFVSAPRRSEEAVTIASKLSNSKIKDWSYKLKAALDRLGYSYSSASIGWQIWEESKRDIERACNSEYLREFIGEFFENVTEQVISEPQTAEFRVLTKKAKNEDAVATMTADLERGRDLKAKQKQPATNADSWSLKLAETVEKYPLTEAFVEQYKLDIKDDSPEAKESAEEMASIFQLFTNNRLNKLKNWVLAQDPDATKEIGELIEVNPVAYNSHIRKTYCNLRLFQDLKLDQLAACYPQMEAAIPDVTHFNAKSPIAAKLWERFRNLDFADLFPTVESIGDFWAVVCRCMSAMGYQSAGKRIRVETDEWHPNGFDRNGKQRYTKSQSLYFSGWRIMNTSGSKTFQEWFPVVIEAVKTLVLKDREGRRQQIERKQSGFSPGEVAA